MSGLKISRYVELKSQAGSRLAFFMSAVSGDRLWRGVWSVLFRLRRFYGFYGVSLTFLAKALMYLVYL